MHYLRIGTLFFGLFLYQDIVQPNFFISHFSNELFIETHLNKNTIIQTNEKVIILENKEQSTIYFFKQKEKQTELIQDKLVRLTKLPEIQTTKSKRTRVGKRMALLTGTMLYGTKGEGKSIK